MSQYADIGAIKGGRGAKEEDVMLCAALVWSFLELTAELIRFYVFGVHILTFLILKCYNAQYVDVFSLSNITPLSKIANI
jgi:hypothetical protein